MGIYDRDYYREEPPPTPAYRGFGGYSMVTTLIIINVVVFVLDMFSARVLVPVGGGMMVETKWLNHVMSLKPDLFTHLWRFYELVTYGFAHSPENILHILFNMYGLWLFGRDVERVYGRHEFLRVYLTLVVLAGLAWVALQQLMTLPSLGIVGASGAVVGIMILFVFNFPRRKFYLLFLPGFPIPAWVLGIVFVGLDVFGAIGVGHANIAYTAHLAGAAFAFLYFRSGMNLGRLWPKSFSRSLNRFKPGAHLRVHDPEDTYRDRDEQADRVLEKLSREGLDSLTFQERRILEDYSRRMRQKHR